MYSRILTPFPVHKSLYCATCLCSLWRNVFIWRSCQYIHTPDRHEWERWTLLNLARLFASSLVRYSFGRTKHIYSHARVYLDSEHATMTPTQAITDPVSLRFLAVKTGLVITGGGFCKEQRSRSCSPIETRPAEITWKRWECQEEVST